MIDAYLELYDANGSLVEGECTTDGYVGLIEIRDFALGERANDAPAAPTPEPVPEAPTAPEAAPVSMFDAINAKMAEKFAGLSEKLKAANLEADKRSQASQTLRVNRGGDAAWDKRVAPLKAAVAEQLQATHKAAADPTGERLTFRIVKDVDAATDNLFLAYCATKVHAKPKDPHHKNAEFQSATVMLMKMFSREAKPFLTFTFDDVRIASYDISYDAGRAHMIETITFKFVKYYMKYTTQTAAGAEGTSSPEIEGTLGGVQE